MSIKNEVLKGLELNKGNTISGEDLASKLNVSRNSIWKAINSLRNEGYLINAFPNKGYCLLEDNDVISEVGIRKYIRSNFTGDIFTYKTIESTNKSAKKEALNDAKNFTLIISEEQTSGKGRMGRSFYSPTGSGIYMSLIIKPSLSINDAVLITTAASVAISRAIKKVTNIDTMIKWVNDIFYNNKKVCGILTEAVTSFESGNIEYIILGIGINFSKPQNGFPSELNDIVTSLFETNPATISRNQLVAEIINELMDIIPQIKDRAFIDEYRQRSIVLGKNIKYIVHGSENYGKVVEINDDGALIILNTNGEKSILNSGEISIRTV